MRSCWRERHHPAWSAPFLPADPARSTPRDDFFRRAARRSSGLSTPSWFVSSLSNRLVARCFARSIYCSFVMLSPEAGSFAALALRAGRGREQHGGKTQDDGGAHGRSPTPSGSTQRSGILSLRQCLRAPVGLARLAATPSVRDPAKGADFGELAAQLAPRIAGIRRSR